MAEAAVSFLLTKLSELLHGEEQLLRGVHDDADYIKDELEYMRFFLRAADAVEDSEWLKVIVMHVTEVAYNMEDALDDFRLSLVRNPRHGNGKFAAAMELASSVKTLGARHRITSLLRRLKGRVQTLIVEQRRFSDLNTELMRLGPTSNSARPIRQFVAVSFDNDIVGLDDHKNRLIEKLLDDKEVARYVVSVVGMGGVGKSTLARMVYDDTEIKNQFKFRAWITVSQAYKIEDLLRNAIQQLCKVLKRAEPQGLDTTDTKWLRKEIGHLLKHTRYLIVLDDVWDTNVWEEFMEVLPKDGWRNRVLLTTRKEPVAFHSCQGVLQNIYALTPLSETDSQTLFKRQLFRNGSCPSNLREITAKFLHRCEGLPLAIVALTGVLSSKDIGRLDEWEMVYNSIGDLMVGNDRLESLKNILSLSYNDLPYYLKSCLLYLSIFPPGNTIKRMRIIRFWVAEGFVKDREGMTLEEVADCYLNELIMRSLVNAVEMTDDGHVKTCHIHDIVREIMISKAKSQFFAAIVKDQGRMWPEKVRRLSIHDASTIIQKRLIGSHSRLRSLLMFWGLDHSPESSTLKLPLQHVRFLNVLHLEGAPLTEFPKHVVNLFLLKYLSLRDTKVDSVPSTIEKLQNIETLDMKHTLVTELPVQILKLQKLRHLLVYRYVYNTDDQIQIKCGFKSPAQIGKLKCIQKLCFLEADQGGELLVEIGKLSQLRKLGIVKLRSSDGKALCSSICKLMNLRALSVTAFSEDEIISMDYLSPPRFLKRLYLTGRLERLPDWISSLHSLMKLALKWSRLTADPLAPLQDLPNLVHLAFVHVYDGEELLFRKNGFQKLKFLGLNRLDNLNSIVLEEGAVAYLEKLVVHSCHSLHKLPLGIEHLTKLKELEFFDMPQELAESLRDTDKINHVQTVNFVDRDSGFLSKYDFKL